MQGGKGIRGPSAAPPGSTVEVEVDSGSDVAVTLPGRPPAKIPVRNGKAAIPIPPNTPHGSLVHVVVLGRLPPEGITIAVVEPRLPGSSPPPGP